jgi:hypothetical protein
VDEATPKQDKVGRQSPSRLYVSRMTQSTLAVIMALSELGQRNPAHFEKLAKAVLTRSPDIVSGLQDFQSLFIAKLKGEAPPPAPPSGVFL